MIYSQENNMNTEGSSNRSTRNRSEMNNAKQLNDVKRTSARQSHSNQSKTSGLEGDGVFRERNIQYDHYSVQNQNKSFDNKQNNKLYSSDYPPEEGTENSDRGNRYHVQNPPRSPEEDNDNNSPSISNTFSPVHEHHRPMNDNDKLHRNKVHVSQIGYGSDSLHRVPTTSAASWIEDRTFRGDGDSLADRPSRQNVKNGNAGRSGTGNNQRPSEYEDNRDAIQSDTRNVQTDKNYYDEKNRQQDNCRNVSSGMDYNGKVRRTDGSVSGAKPAGIRSEDPDSPPCRGGSNPSKTTSPPVLASGDKKTKTDKQSAALTEENVRQLRKQTDDGMSHKEMVKQKLMNSVNMSCPVSTSSNNKNERSKIGTDTDILRYPEEERKTGTGNQELPRSHNIKQPSVNKYSSEDIDSSVSMKCREAPKSTGLPISTDLRYKSGYNNKLLPQLHSRASSRDDDCREDRLDNNNNRGGGIRERSLSRNRSHDNLRTGGSQMKRPSVNKMKEEESDEENGGIMKRGNAEKKFLNFKLAERAGRTICVCGASSFYERERYSLQNDQKKLSEEAQRVRDASNKLLADQRDLKSSFFEIEKKNEDLERRRRSLERRKEIMEEEETLLTHSRSGLQKQIDQLEEDRKKMRKSEIEIEKQFNLLHGARDENEKQTLENEMTRQDLNDREHQLNCRMESFAVENQKLNESKIKIEKDFSFFNSEMKKLEESKLALQEREQKIVESEERLKGRESQVEILFDDLKERENELMGQSLRLSAMQDDMKQKENQLRQHEEQLIMWTQKLEQESQELEEERNRLTEEFETERNEFNKSFEMDKEDFQRTSRHERELLEQEKENLVKRKQEIEENLEKETQQTRDHLAELKKRNQIAIETERQRWEKEFAASCELRDQKNAELDRHRKELAEKESKLVEQRREFQNSQKKLYEEKKEFENNRREEEQRNAIQKENSNHFKQSLDLLSQKLENDQKMLQQQLQDVHQRTDQLSLAEAEVDSIRSSLRQQSLCLQDREEQLRMAECDLQQDQTALEKAVDQLRQRELRLTTAEGRSQWLSDASEDVKVAEKQLLMERSTVEWQMKKMEETERKQMIHFQKQEKEIQEYSSQLQNKEKELLAKEKKINQLMKLASAHQSVSSQSSDTKKEKFDDEVSAAMERLRGHQLYSPICPSGHPDSMSASMSHRQRSMLAPPTQPLYQRRVTNLTSPGLSQDQKSKANILRNNFNLKFTHDIHGRRQDSDTEDRKSEDGQKIALNSGDKNNSGRFANIISSAVSLPNATPKTRRQDENPNALGRAYPRQSPPVDEIPSIQRENEAEDQMPTKYYKQNNNQHYNNQIAVVKSRLQNYPQSAIRDKRRDCAKHESEIEEGVVFSRNNSIEIINYESDYYGGQQEENGNGSREERTELPFLDGMQLDESLLDSRQPDSSPNVNDKNISIEADDVSVDEDNVPKESSDYFHSRVGSLIEVKQQTETPPEQNGGAGDNPDVKFRREKNTKDGYDSGYESIDESEDMVRDFSGSKSLPNIRLSDSDDENFDMDIPYDPQRGSNNDKEGESHKDQKIPDQAHQSPRGNSFVNHLNQNLARPSLHHQDPPQDDASCSVPVGVSEKPKSKIPERTMSLVSPQTVSRVPQAGNKRTFLLNTLSSNGNISQSPQIQTSENQSSLSSLSNESVSLTGRNFSIDSSTGRPHYPLSARVGREMNDDGDSQGRRIELVQKLGCPTSQYDRINGEMCRTTTGDSAVSDSNFGLRNLNDDLRNSADVRPLLSTPSVQDGRQSPTAIAKSPDPMSTESRFIHNKTPPLSAGIIIGETNMRSISNDKKFDGGSDLFVRTQGKDLKIDHIREVLTNNKSKKQSEQIDDRENIHPKIISR